MVLTQSEPHAGIEVEGQVHADPAGGRPVIGRSRTRTSRTGSRICTLIVSATSTHASRASEREDDDSVRNPIWSWTWEARPPQRIPCCTRCGPTGETARERGDSGPGQRREITAAPLCRETVPENRRRSVALELVEEALIALRRRRSSGFSTCTPSESVARKVPATLPALVGVPLILPVASRATVRRAPETSPRGAASSPLAFSVTSIRLAHHALQTLRDEVERLVDPELELLLHRSAELVFRPSLRVVFRSPSEFRRGCRGRIDVEPAEPSESTVGRRGPPLMSRSAS
jgi:hypothetical protein